MAKQLITGFLAALAWFSTALGQEESHVRWGSIALGVGPAEIVSLGISKQLSPSLQIGLVLGGFQINRHLTFSLNAVGGIGFRGSYFLSPDGQGNFLRVNNLSCDLVYLTPFETPASGNLMEPSGVGIETTIGHDCILGSGVGFFWGVGLSVSFHREAPPLYFPALKCGIHADF